MKSIFDLKTKNSELSSSNQGLANYKYQEIQSLRSILGSKFADGQIIFRWTYGSNKYWIPSKSYLKIRLKITKQDGVTPLNAYDDITFCMNTIPCLFQASSYKIADQTVCNITQNLPQIDTLKNRMYKSASWLDSMGQSINNWSHKFSDIENKFHQLGDSQTLIKTKTWQGIVQELGILAADTVTLAKTTPADFSYSMTWGAGVTRNWGVIVQIGDILEFTLDRRFVDANDPAVVIGSELRPYTWRGVVKFVLGDFVSYIPFTGDSPVAVAVQIMTGPLNFKVEIYRGGRYADKASHFADTIELMWRPCLSIFDSIQTVIPCAGTKHEFTLTPYPEGVYQRNCVQSIGAPMVHGSAGQYMIEIKDMRFYALTCDSNRIQENFQFMLDLNEVQCQSTPIINELQQQSLDVIGSTDAITIAFIDSDCLNSTLYPMTKFRVRNNIESNLKRYYIRYEGQVPLPDGEGEYIALAASEDLDLNKIDTITDWYHRTKIYDGTYFTENPESLNQYRARGMYIHHRFPKTASSRNTRVYVSTQFSNLLDANGVPQQPFLLMFSHYKKVVMIKVQNGRIIRVTQIDA